MSSGKWGHFVSALIYWYDTISTACPLQWRHNGCDSVSNHQPHDRFLNRLFRHRSKKTLKLRVTGLCAGNSPEAGEFLAQMASNEENVSIWWRHHVFIEYLMGSSIGFGCIHSKISKWTITGHKLLPGETSTLIPDIHYQHRVTQNMSTFLFCSCFYLGHTWYV